MSNNNMELSQLSHTWILDLDGTIVKHNGYKIDGKDSFLEGAEDFLKSIPIEDTIIFVTSRQNAYKDATISFLKENNVRYSQIIFEIPYGERILMNDDKPSGLKMGIAYNKLRDSASFPNIIINQDI